MSIFASEIDYRAQNLSGKWLTMSHIYIRKFFRKYPKISINISFKKSDFITITQLCDYIAGTTPRSKSTPVGAVSPSLARLLLISVTAHRRPRT